MLGKYLKTDSGEVRKGRLLLLDILITLIFIATGLFFIPDHSIIVGYLFVVPYLLITGRRKMVKHFLVATLIALIWILLSVDYYGYQDALLTVGGVNLFPLFAWATGLFLSYLVYTYYMVFFGKKGLIFKFLMYVAMYWPLLVIMETIGYHVFNIHNEATAQYDGLPLLDSMHAPAWMRLSYFSMGPILFLISYQLDRIEDRKKKLDRDEE